MVAPPSCTSVRLPGVRTPLFKTKRSHPSPFEQLIIASQRLTDDQLLELASKAEAMVTLNLALRYEPVSVGVREMPKEYPAFQDALPNAQSLLAQVTGKTPIEKVVLGKDIWVVQGFCQGSILGEPGTVRPASTELLADVGVIDDKEAVAILEAVCTAENPTSISVSLKSMQAASFVATGALQGRLARLLLPILQQWALDLLNDKLGDMLDRVNK